MKISYTLTITASLLAITPVAFAAGENKATKVLQENRLKHAAAASGKGLLFLGGSTCILAQIGGTLFFTCNAVLEDKMRNAALCLLGGIALFTPGIVAFLPHLKKLGLSTLDSAKKAWASSDTETTKA